MNGSIPLRCLLVGALALTTACPSDSSSSGTTTAASGTTSGGADGGSATDTGGKNSGDAGASTAGGSADGSDSAGSASAGTASGGSASAGSDSAGSDSAADGGGDGGAEVPYCHAACDDATPCTPTSYCDAGQCTIGCQDVSDCGDSQVCVDNGNGLHCANACSDPSECALSLGPAWDASHWTCEQGGCRYQGCMNDTECGDGMVCRMNASLTALLFGYDAPVCVPTCTSPADCDQGSAGLSADNYECVDGGCNWIGCQSDSDCLASQTCI